MLRKLLSFQFILFIAYVGCKAINLKKISTLYVPSSYSDTGTPLFSPKAKSSEQLAYDTQSKFVYVVGSSKLNVIDINDVENPQIIYHKMMGDFDPTDVEFCGDHVFVTLDDNQDSERGRVVVFTKFDPKKKTMDTVLNITVGPLPDMVQPSSDCRTVLIALEGKAFARNGELVDPEGGVGLLKFHDLSISAANYSYKRLDFTRYNDRWNSLSKTGVRFIYKEQNNKFSQDLEPEYISFSKDERKAYICLQENNAIAVVDLGTENITAIHGLGFKNWRNSKLDASDKDGGINIRPLPVYGMYQPDAIHVINVNGEEYLVTSNEGGGKDYSDYKLNATAFSEEIRARDVSISENSEINQWMLQNNISNILDNSVLGRLVITTETGRLPDGSFDKLYTFGGRGFSIWKADTMALVYDSGSDVEDTHAQARPDLFNAQLKAGKKIKKTIDYRSDNKGPESESLAIGHDGDKILIFVGHERPGSISVYSVNGDISSPKFESVFWDIPNSEQTWTEAFEQRSISVIDPEDLKYISAKESPNGRPLLLVAGSVSGTLSILEVIGFNMVSATGAV
eukprot:XP_011436760.1 PREDICTED: mesenchyme-specific cell surface glycoprotein [Crassostrea gigas]